MGGFQTPPLKTVVDTSTRATQKLKTNILPIVVDGVPSYSTLTQTYNVKILVEATKTLPYEITPTKTFNIVQKEKEEVAADLLRQLLPGKSGTNNNKETLSGKIENSPLRTPK